MEHYISLILKAVFVENMALAFRVRPRTHLPPEQTSTPQEAWRIMSSRA